MATTARGRKESKPVRQRRSQPGVRRSEPAVMEFIERFAASLTAAGMPLQASRVFVALLADDEGRMTAAQVAERLHLSPASVSGAVQYLARIDLIRKERERGSRRDVYVVMGDAWHDTLLSRDRVLDSLSSALASGIDELGAETPAGRRLRLSHEFLSYVGDEMGRMADGWEQRRRELAIDDV
jgi:predicted transcriptional regulator